MKKAQSNIEYWTAEELEKTSQAYVDTVKSKYSFTDSQVFDLIFTTLDSGQRMNKIYRINKWHEPRKIDCDTMGQATHVQFSSSAIMGTNYIYEWKPEHWACLILFGDPQQIRTC